MLPDGGTRWLKALGRGFYDRQGRPARFDGITVDITRQKDAESALADAIRMKDDFLATISHELRTPLNAVLGWARMLSSGQVPPHRVEHAMTVIERNAQAQARLVEELLDLSRIESGQLRLHVEPVDAGSVVQSALEAVRPAAEARGVELVTAIDPTARWISADGDRLRQVAWNLLSNAVKFTPEGGRVTLALVAGRARRCAWWSPIPDVASRRHSCHGCSTGSLRPTHPRRAACEASASAWRSCASWWRRTAAPWKCPAPAKVTARPSRSRCPAGSSSPAGFTALRRSADGTLGIAQLGYGLRVTGYGVRAAACR